MSFPYFTHELDFNPKNNPKPKRRFRFINTVTGEKKAVNAINEFEARKGLSSEWVLSDKKWKPKQKT